MFTFKTFAAELLISINNLMISIKMASSTLLGGGQTSPCLSRSQARIKEESLRLGPAGCKNPLAKFNHDRQSDVRPYNAGLSW